MSIQYDKHGNDASLPEPLPEHEHIWAVVQIRGNPVGVMCRLCDQTLPIAEE